MKRLRTALGLLAVSLPALLIASCGGKEDPGAGICLDDDYCADEYCPATCDGYVTDAVCGDEDVCVCECCPSIGADDHGGTPESPVAWEEEYTCIDDEGNCLNEFEEQVRATLELVQLDTRITWEIVSDAGLGSRYIGDYCQDDFVWTSEPGTFSEDGCWTFAGDTFLKTSYGAGFYCYGTGSKGRGTTPAPAPTCAELAAANIDFSECPSPLSSSRLAVPESRLRFEADGFMRP